MGAWGGTGCPAKDELIAHEFAVVFPEGSFRGAIAGVGDVGARRPLPNIAEHLEERASIFGGTARRRVKTAGFEEMTRDGHVGRSGFPFGFPGKSVFRPARE